MSTVVKIKINGSKTWKIYLNDRIPFHLQENSQRDHILLDLHEKQKKNSQRNRIPFGLQEKQKENSQRDRIPFGLQEKQMENSAIAFRLICRKTVSANTFRLICMETKKIEKLTKTCVYS